MFTLFSCPKPFHGLSGITQRNAIQSWVRLDPRPEIILVGDEKGTAGTAREFKLRHIPQVACNPIGTPLVNSIFSLAQEAATHETVCYINADIILISDFVVGVRRVVREIPYSLMVGRRWNLEIKEAIDFSEDWERGLKTLVGRRGKLYPHFGIDYFVFPKGVWGKIPPFAIGRPGWDNWMLYRAHTLNLPIVDLTRVTTVIHQNHDYSHHPHGWVGASKGEEAKRNQSLAGEGALVYSLLDAQYSLTRKGVRRRIRPYHSPFYIYRSFVIFSDSHPFVKPLVHLIKRIGDRFFSHPR
jgi:hypothetical protein